MLLIVCPHCGPRASIEFTFRGATTPRPSVDATTPAGWRAYLYERENLAGNVEEEWFHTAGCRRFLLVERNTIDNRITSVRDRADR
jgi:heterotetrameric sarcosine oxidase delta subunit